MNEGAYKETMTKNWNVTVTLGGLFFTKFVEY